MIKPIILNKPTKLSSRVLFVPPFKKFFVFLLVVLDLKSSLRKNTDSYSLIDCVVSLNRDFSLLLYHF